MIVVGLLCGTLAGTFGIGGGTIMVPALVLLCMPQKDAQGTALAVMIPVAIVGVWCYKTSPDINLDLGVAAILAIGSIIGVILGSKIALALNVVLLKRLFAIVMILVALAMLFARPDQAKPPGPDPAESATDS